LFIAFGLSGGVGCAGADGADDSAAHGESPTPAAQTAQADGAPSAAGEVIDHHADLRGKCKINSGYPSDEACIPAPPPEEGFQIHVGPSDYTNKEEVAKFILKPGEETSECWTFKTPNGKPVTYQTAVLSGRAGTHHIINTMYAGDLPMGQFTVCGGGRASGTGMQSIGTLPGASKPYMGRGSVPPEYAHVGRSIPANATVQADMHYFNFTNRDILREFWLNIYYAKDESKITQTADQIAGLGGFSWNQSPIAPGTDKVYKYQCPIRGNGHIISLLGHYHAHGKRLSAYIQRKSTGENEKVFEMYDYLTPATFEYNTVVKNPTFSDNVAGAVTGVLPVSDGDILQWECHIINDSKVGLRYVNEVNTGEMCNLWGASVGISPFNCYQP
jgi:hypothetical protein